MAIGPKYPNQQLHAVSLETYFHGELAALGALGRIQRLVRDDLPNLFVPNAQDGEPLALKPYQLRSVDQKKSLALAVNQATYISYDYPGYSSFREEALSRLEPALKEFGVSGLNRVVYRYENEIGLGRSDQGTLAVDALFPGIFPNALVAGASGMTRTINSAYEEVWRANGRSGIKGFSARVEEQGPAGVILRVGIVGSIETFDRMDLGAAADEAHDVAVSLFENLISESFRKFISTGTEEND